MAKKKKKKGSGSLISGKTRKKFIRLALIAFLAYAGYALYNPNIIQNEEYRQKAISIRDQISNTSNFDPDKLPFKLPEKVNLARIAQFLPQGEILGDKDLYVEEAFQQVTDKLKQLPQEQAKKIKADFCSDVVTQPSDSIQDQQ